MNDNDTVEQKIREDINKRGKKIVDRAKHLQSSLQWQMSKYGGMEYGLHVQLAAQELIIEIRETYDATVEALIELKSIEKGYHWPGFDPDNLANLKLSARSYNALLRSGYLTISEIEQASTEELLSVRSFGQRSLQETQVRLETWRKEHPREEKGTTK